MFYVDDNRISHAIVFFLFDGLDSFDLQAIAFPLFRLHIFALENSSLAVGVIGDLLKTRYTVGLLCFCVFLLHNYYYLLVIAVSATV